MRTGSSAVQNFIGIKFLAKLRIQESTHGPQEILPSTPLDETEGSHSG